MGLHQSSTSIIFDRWRSSQNTSKSSTSKFSKRYFKMCIQFLQFRTHIRRKEGHSRNPHVAFNNDSCDVLLKCFYYIFHPPSETDMGWVWLWACITLSNGMHITSPLRQTVVAAAEYILRQKTHYYYYHDVFYLCVYIWWWLNVLLEICKLKCIFLWLCNDKRHYYHITINIYVDV